MTRFYLHVLSDTIDQQDDQGWLKIEQKGWWKAKFKTATPFMSLEEALAVPRIPTMNSIKERIIVVKVTIDYAGALHT